MFRSHMGLYADIRSQLEHLEPFVISGSIMDWKASRWTREELARIINPAQKDDHMSVRFGPKEHVRGKILFENESKMAHISSLEQFFKWFCGEETLTAKRADDDRCEMDRAHYWGYFDYHYVFDIMDPDHIVDIDWRSLGLEVNPVESTIWIGTPGAYTPCHYDSYGYNVHAQLSGSKRWILFEPNEDMKSTRIPYEESTIFSDLDVVGADNSLQDKKIRMITLNKGDVIFIPPGWWHCVQCVPVNDHEKDLDNISVSVNTWVPLAGYDRISYLHEAAASTMITFLMRAGLLTNEHICPSETVLSYDDSLFDFRRVLTKDKYEKRTDDGGLHRLFDFVAKNRARMKVVPAVSFDEFRTEQQNGPLKIVDPPDECVYPASSTTSTNMISFQKHFINSLFSEEVLNALITQLQKRT